jgi:hypothetical protein
MAKIGSAKNGRRCMEEVSRGVLRLEPDNLPSDFPWKGALDSMQAEPWLEEELFVKRGSDLEEVWASAGCSREGTCAACFSREPDPPYSRAEVTRKKYDLLKGRIRAADLAKAGVTCATGWFGGEIYFVKHVASGKVTKAILSLPSQCGKEIADLGRELDRFIADTRSVAEFRSRWWRRVRIALLLLLGAALGSAATLAVQRCQPGAANPRVQTVGPPASDR